MLGNTHLTQIDSRIAALLLHHEIDQFNARYAAALDACNV